MDGLVILVIAIVSICSLLLSMQLSSLTKDLRKRLDAQDDQIARIAERVGVPSPRVRVDPAVREALAGGKNILAIKLYREATGTDLKSAKQAVERIEADGAQDRPA